MTFNKFVLFLGFVTTALGAERPEYILPCRRVDPEINKCIKGSFTHLRPYLARGLPELDVPSLEPFKITELAMENNAGAVRIKALFSDILTMGISNFTVKDVRSDVKRLRIDLSLGVPRVEVRGKYEINGQVLVLPVRSNGEFWTEFSNVNAIIKVYGKEQNRDGELYMTVDKLGFDFNMKSARFKVKDNLNSANVLGEAINQFLNQNALEIIQEMRPAASQSIAKVFKDVLDKAFRNIAIKLWLTDE